MRRYAMLYRESTNDWNIIYRDETDPLDVWYVMQEEVMKQEVAETIVNALNAQSH